MFWWVAISPLSLAYNVVLNVVLADKHQQDYSKTISWLRYSTRLSLMTSALSDGGMLIIPCTNRPDQCMECKVPLDVVICEGRIASHSTLNYSFTNFCPSTLLYIWLISIRAIPLVLAGPGVRSIWLYICLARCMLYSPLQSAIYG